MSERLARHTRVIRLFELERLKPLLPPAPARIVEIGGGDGWMAANLVALGYRVESFDVQPWPNEHAHPVRRYDGVHLPVADGGADVVVSSSVLEHVIPLDQLEVEIHRVLAPHGRAIHIVPTPWWRWWTSLTYYPALPIILPAILGQLRAQRNHPGGTPAPASARAATTAPAPPGRAITARRLAKWMGTLAMSPRHGDAATDSARPGSSAPHGGAITSSPAASTSSRKCPPAYSTPAAACWRAGSPSPRAPGWLACWAVPAGSS